jgi:hypothetical protein
MSGQPLPEHRPFDGRWTGWDFSIYLSRFSASLQPAFDRGQGDPEGPRDLRSRHPTIYRIQRLQSEVLRIRSHAREFRRGSSIMQAAVRRCPRRGPCRRDRGGDEIHTADIRGTPVGVGSAGVLQVASFRTRRPLFASLVLVRGTPPPGATLCCPSGTGEGRVPRCSESRSRVASRFLVDYVHAGNSNNDHDKSIGPNPATQTKTYRATPLPLASGVVCYALWA